MHSEPEILSTFIGKLLSYGETRGLMRRLMLEEIGLPTDTAFNPDLWLPIEHSMQLWEFLMRQLNDPGIPIDVTRFFNPEDYHAFGFAIMTSRDISEALERAVRYSRFFTTVGFWDIDIGAKTVTATWRRGPTTSLGQRVATENTLAEFVNTVRQTTGSNFTPEQVSFQHERPFKTDAHDEFFETQISFSCGSDSITFGTEWLQVPMSQTNPALASFMDGYLTSRMKDLDSSEPWSQNVRKLLLEILPSGDVSSKRMARRLGTSERSLRRHLSTENTTYRQILSSVRRERASYLLAETRMPIGEIAFVLGFSDAAVFSRAFRRQAGQSPVEFRNTLALED